MKPWEKYAKQNQPAQAQGPWNKYQATGADASVIAGYADKLTPDNKMPEWLDKRTRFEVQNFSNTPADAVKKLKSKFPDKEFAVNANGDIIGRTPGENWGKLDPVSETLSTDFSDFGNDITDVGYDIGSGLVQGAATAAGAVGGALTPVPGGALMGGAGANAAASGFTEAMRQKLGQWAGIDQEFDKGRVGEAAAIGGLSTLAFGANKAVPGLAQKGYGALKAGVRNTTGFLTNIDSNILKNYADRSDIIKGLPGEATMARDISNKAISYVDDRLERDGTKLASEMEALGMPVDIAGAKKAFQDRLTLLKSRTNRNPAEEAEIASLQNTYDKYFSLATPIAPDDATILADPQMQKLYSQVDQLAVTPKLPASQVGQTINASQVPENLARQSMSGKSVAPINAVTQGHADLLASESEALAQAVASKNEAAVKQVLKQIEARRAAVIEEQSVRYVPDQVEASRAWDWQKQLSQEAAWEQGVTPATLSAKGSAKKAYGAINDSMSAESDGLIGELKKAYAKSVSRKDTIYDKFGANAANETNAAQTTLSNILNLDKPGRRALLEDLASMKDEGLDIGQDILDLQTKSKMNSAPTVGKVTRMAAMLGGAGGALGYRVGAGTGAAMGASIGIGTGAALSDPRLVRKAIDAVGGAEKLVRNVGTLGGNISSDVPFYLMPNQVANESAQAIRQQKIWDELARQESLKNK